MEQTIWDIKLRSARGEVARRGVMGPVHAVCKPDGSARIHRLNTCIGNEIPHNIDKVPSCDYQNYFAVTYALQVNLLLRCMCEHQIRWV